MSARGGCEALIPERAPMNEGSVLSHHPRLTAVLPAVAQAARALYGRQLELADDKQPLVRVRWQEVNAGAADVQIEAKWAGHVVDVQFVDASWWGALAIEWADEVPEPVRRAAFVHAAHRPGGRNWKPSLASSTCSASWHARCRFHRTKRWA
jgi:hypothetical protein